MGRLQGRVALVTGGGGGLGSAIVRRFAAEGATVIVNDIGVALDGTGGDASVATCLVDEVVASGGRAEADGTDISSFDAVGELIGRIVADHGSVDVLVHSAGVLRDRMVFNMSVEEWDLVQQVHLRGLFNLTRHVAAHWRSTADTRQHRRLITVTSRSGFLGGVGQPNYAAAKLGVVGFTYSCARALARYGATSNSVCPTADTRMTATMSTESRVLAEGSAEGSPDNVARVVAYMASDRSHWLNGQVVGSMGFEVQLYSKPVVARRLHRDGPWDPEDLGESIEAAFRPLVEEGEVVDE